ncbi:hypothetical protein B0H34DRAFT_833314 [Crassisporium funariophilum]|nr:hypothetical protein B0H34DRAFT_833314 [Crassisporium funariophilum]
MATTTTNSNTVESNNAMILVSSEGSKITAVSLYSGRAEVTRLFKFDIKAGQNQILIKGLPRTLLENSLRVEGQGNASIHDVIVSRTPRPPSLVAPAVASDSKKRKLEEMKKALESAHQSRTALKVYLGTFNAHDVPLLDLESALIKHSALTRKWDTQILDLEKEVAELEIALNSNVPPVQAYDASWQVVINVSGQVNEEVVILLKYAVYGADWKASYDIRVDTQATEKAVVIDYKAVITQGTGESWEGVPLTLETATPTFGISAPTLAPWNLHVYVERPAAGPSRERERHGRRRSYAPGSPRYDRRHSSSADDLSPTSPRYSPPSPTFSPQRPKLPMIQTSAEVSSKGNVAATFRVPGLITVPSDSQKHNVSITQLEFNARLIWYAIPKLDTRTHLKAKFKNDSEYTFILGSANIYVDGSFIATTQLPSVSPSEMFDCPLGLDPSVRIVYHPCEKKASQSGFYQKNSTQSFTQGITVLNTKMVPLPNLMIVDNIPVSQDERIEVNLIQPALALPASGPASKKIAGGQKPENMINGVTLDAQWGGVEESGSEEAATGKDGKLHWMLSLPAQTTTTLLLQYEVIYSKTLLVEGL